MVEIVQLPEEFKIIPSPHENGEDIPDMQEEFDRINWYFKPTRTGYYTVIVTRSPKKRVDYYGKEQCHFYNTIILSTPYDDHKIEMKAFFATRGLWKKLVKHVVDEDYPKKILIRRTGRGRNTKWYCRELEMEKEEFLRIGRLEVTV